MNFRREPKLKTNLDTDLLKLIAIIAMVIDHVGAAFFPDITLFRLIGRIAFPLFCYCLTVGMMYTHNIKKYLIRLGIFAIVSQPFWILAFNHQDFWGNLLNMNIFFTLFITLLSVWAFKEHKWWLFVIGVIITFMFNFDYSITGIVLMLIFYLCRNKPWLGAVLFTINYLPALWGNTPGSYMTLTINNYAISLSLFSILALPLIYLKTKTGIRISKWFFYGFYPVHLLLIYLVQMLLPILTK